MAYQGNSIVDYIKSLGGDSGYGARSTLAASKGIKGYTGTADQNTALLGAMRGTAAPSATATTPTAIATPTGAPTQSPAAQSYMESQMGGDTSAPSAPDPNASYRSALDSYMNSLKGSDAMNAKVDKASIASRRGIEDALDAPGGLKQGAQETAALFSRRANANLADLGVAQDAATRATSGALERLKYEGGLLPKPGEAFNLSPGQKRYDASGKLIAESAPNAPSISEQYGTGAIGEYNFAKSQGYQGSFSQYQNEDANRKARATSAASASGLSTTAQVNAMKQTLKTGIAPSGVPIGNPQGADGYVDPSVYMALYNNWPGTTSDFKTKFPVSNVNPASYGMLPEALRPKASSGRQL
jgi:hypothetical protein